MSAPHDIDGVLIHSGTTACSIRATASPQPKLGALAARQRAAPIRERIEANVVRRPPQVMVKVTRAGEA